MEFDIPSILISLFSFLIFFFIFLQSQSMSKSTNTYSHLPGPKPLPLIGNLHLMLRATPPPHRMFARLAARYGPLMHLQLGEIHFLIVSSADLAKQVTKIHDINFANRPPGKAPATLTYDYTDVIVAPYGDYWRQLRKVCTVELLSARRVQSFLPLRVEENMNVARSIASCQGSPVNLSEKVYMSAYDVITRATIGGKTKERAAVIAMIEEIMRLSSGFHLADLYPSIKLVSLITGNGYKLRRMRRKIDAMLDPINEQHRMATDNGGIENLIDVLLRIQADEKEITLTNDNIKAVILDMFVAGTDTSATAVEWAMSEMIKNPSKLKRAQEEVRKVFDDMGYIDEERFGELKYLKLIIKETLRMHPPAPLLLPRISSESCEINGYEIPAKTRVLVNAWALGRDPEYWNEPDKFEPERFEESSIDFKGNNLEYIPFGAGRRMCPGMTFGLANLEFPLVTLLYHFDWKMPFGMKNEELDMTESFGAIVSRKHHLRLVPIVKRPLPAAA